MNSGPYFLGIDQGTSGSRALVLDGEGKVCGYGYRSLPRIHPHPGWTEQDMFSVVSGVKESIAEALAQAGIRPRDILACGIDCQRNTDFIWDHETRQPLGNAITWQDLRTQDMLCSIEKWKDNREYRYRLGREPGVFSSALHLAWRLQHDPQIKAAAADGRLQVGFSAEWLLVAMGEPNSHQMDFSLVQAMGLYDFRAHEYWDEWLAYLGIPRDPLPAPCPSVWDYGVLRISDLQSETADIPVLAMIGDQQAALFGYDCHSIGDAECTHGTASFVNVFLGDIAPEHERLNVYYAWDLGGIPSIIAKPQSRGKPTYCLEADTTVTGAALRWMRETARLLDREDEVGVLAAGVPDSGGVMFVPAFTGLNVPYNNPQARGSLLGLTLGSNRAQIARAFLDSIGFQIRAILETIRNDTGLVVEQLRVGGGVSANDLACQIQADWLGIPVIRPEFTQTTARAAALLAGIGAGYWKSLSDLPPLPGGRTVFEPSISDEQRDAGYSHWKNAITTVQNWAKVEPLQSGYPPEADSL